MNRLTHLLRAAALAGALAALSPVGLAAAPEFDIKPLADGRLEIVWQDAESGYVLQESEVPGGEVWLGVAQAPVVNGLQRTVTRTLPVGTVRKFYRLRSRGVFAGLDYLLATQEFDGLWAEGPGCRGSGEAAGALELYGEHATALGRAVAGLADAAVRNNDDRARKLVGLAMGGGLTGSLAEELLGMQGAEVHEANAPGYPGRGWGLGAGYGSSTIDTALVLRGLRAAGYGGGMALHKMSVGAGATAAAIPFMVPAGATGQLLKVRQVTGASLRFMFLLPGGGNSFVDVAPRNGVLNVFFPEVSGDWQFEVHNLGGAAASYSAEFGFETAGGEDTFGWTTPLSYLAGAQNGDGGWGIGKGEDSHLMISAEVLRALAGWGGVFHGPGVLGGGADWVREQQNGDGGFSGDGGVSNAHETALAMLALRAAEPGGALGTAAGWLKGAQGPDGSWGGSVAVTALAVQALRLGPVVGPIAGQSVAAPALFAPLNLDSLVTDADHADNQLTWTVTGNSQLDVSIVNRVATITYPEGTTPSETLTFTATDPDTLSGSASAVFEVTTLPPVDYMIARGGNVTDARRISGALELLNQTMSFTQQVINAPLGVTYNLLVITRPTDTEFEFSFQINVGAGAPLGDHQFQVVYELHDENPPVGPPLGPVSGNVFEFSIRITP